MQNGRRGTGANHEHRGPLSRDGLGRVLRKRLWGRWGLFPVAFVDFYSRWARAELAVSEVDLVRTEDWRAFRECYEMSGSPWGAGSFTNLAERKMYIRKAGKILFAVRRPAHDLLRDDKLHN